MTEDERELSGTTFPIISGYFDNFPARKKVVEVLLKYGLSVRNGKVYLGDSIEVPISAIAKAARVNRRIVYMTIEYIEKMPSLRIFFSKLRPTLSLVELAPFMGWEVLEIEELSEVNRCVFSDVLKAIFESNCQIRQVIGEKYEMGFGRYYIVLEGRISPDVIQKIGNIPGVLRITLRTPEKDKTKLVCTYCEVKYCPRMGCSIVRKK
ncbi:MAG TPA: regulator of amino acid metabolism, contains ACT domain protein [Thermoprotei archaeon]|nr:regulator of amino acid metabolism, contains ACT domain protein [Thermoprotei archaeon]